MRNEKTEDRNHASRGAAEKQMITAAKIRKTEKWKT